MRNTKKSPIGSPISSPISSSNKYTLGTCYGCQICLHCKNKNNNCNFNKNIKPEVYKEYKNSKKRIAYSRKFLPSTIDNNNSQRNYLYEKNQYFDYGIDFSTTFSIYFCPKCHSKFCRVSKKRAYTSKIQSTSKMPLNLSSPSKKSSTSSLSPYKSRILSPSPTIISSLQSSPNNIPKSDNEHVALSLKFKLSIKKSDNSFLSQKWINMKLTSHFDFIYDIKKQVKKILDLLKLNKNDYTLSYQALNTRGLDI